MLRDGDWKLTGKACKAEYHGYFGAVISKDVVYVGIILPGD